MHPEEFECLIVIEAWSGAGNVEGERLALMSFGYRSGAAQEFVTPTRPFLA
jgi:hypothetical protein